MAATDYDRIVHDDGSYGAAVGDGLVLLDFWTGWCGPCTALEPVVEELVEGHPRLTVAKIDADENETTMEEFGVRSIPTVILLERGEPVEAFVGKVASPKLKLERAVEKHARGDLFQLSRRASSRRVASRVSASTSVATTAGL
ncbi:thiol reductase thioredoxin [Halobacteriales archaeon QS_9_70_65]|nr:MAG: thiol reductase thioredoxin [Halobacteriales archaeon QS_9_70_65]